MNGRSMTFSAVTYYQTSSCSRNILGAYNPISTLKTAPQRDEMQNPANFEAARGFGMLQSGDLNRVLACISACSPLEYCGNSCEINSMYFPRKQLWQCRNAIRVQQSGLVSIGSAAKPAQAASQPSRLQPAECESQCFTKRSCSRNDLKGYSLNMYLTIAPDAAETNAIALQRPERHGTDLIEDGTGTLVGKTGGAYDVNSMAYVGGGYECRKCVMGSMTLLGINLLGEGKNTVRPYYKNRSFFRFILNGCRPELLKNSNRKCKAPSIKNIASGETVIG